MSAFKSCAFAGSVVHKRLAPRRHAFRYRVFALCLDVDEIDKLSSGLRLFSRGRWNLLSFHDADHGAGTGQPVGQLARELLQAAGLAQYGARIELLCYPRLLGYVFNPLSVYFGHDANGRLGAVIYEVTNTLNERRSYVIEAGSVREQGVISQRCSKALYVSPFTEADASYGFHVVPPGERVVVGVDLREQGKPVLKTHFAGSRIPLSDRAIARLLLAYPLMTFKVVAAIHLEALRLWLKGIPVQPYHSSPRYSSIAVRTTIEKAEKV